MFVLGDFEHFLFTELRKVEAFFECENICTLPVVDCNLRFFIFFSER
jgi:hypothetical protein